MDTTKLQYFCNIAETGSLRKSSELLRISSPALSKAMKNLESDLGVQLFLHEGRNIILSDAGKELASRGQKILRELNLLKNDLEIKKSSNNELKIATFEVFSTYFLNSYDKDILKEKNLILHEVLPGELEKALADNEVDFGITYMPIASPNIDHIKVGSIEMGVYTHKNAFPGSTQVDLPFVVPVFPITGSPTRIRGLDGWPEDAYPRKILHQVTLMESALELCRQGHVAGYFPIFIVEENNRRYKEAYHLVRRASPFKGRKCTTDVFIAKRKSDIEDSKTIKQLARVIRKVCV